MSSTGAPVTISPPSERRYEASAFAMLCEPPRAMGHPTACPAATRVSPKAAVGERVRGTMLWAAFPAKSARASSPWNRRFASPYAGRMPYTPKRASSSGWSGNSSGPSTSSASTSQRRTHGFISFFQARASGPSVAPVSSSDRSSMATVPSSCGCARQAGECTHSSPCSASGSARKKGDDTPRGCTVEHTSW